MKKIITSVCFLFFAVLTSYSQIQTIRPDSAFQGQTLTTTITMAAGSFSFGSPPMQNTDIYLQGGTTIYTYVGYDPFINVYWGTDSLWTEFTIPANAPSGLYDVHVVTYDWQGIPTDWILTNGFRIGTFTGGTVEGDIYFDSNQNGIWDGAEPPLYNHKVLVSPGNFYVYSNAAGHYKAYLDSGNYTFSYVPNVSFSQTSLPVTYNATVPPSQTGYDFGAYSAQSLYNQSFYVWHHPMRCQPSLGYTYVDITNNGLMPVQGSVTMVHSSNMTLNTALPAPDIISGDTLTWYYPPLAPGQSFHIGGANGMDWMAFNDPPAGQTIWYSTIDSVFDLGGNPLTQYADSFSFLVTCSCDPNDKHVSPMGSTSQHYTPPNTDLSYTVNFQNTGNDTAFTVIITDTLDANLDWNTFEVISSTHDVYAQMDPNGIVTFTFQNILLPDSNVDEPGSHGAVAYKIRTDSLLPDPTEINNTAYIYFDWNPAVITNTTKNTITELQFPVAAFTTGNVSFCPGNCIGFTNLTNTMASFQWSFPGGNPGSSTSTDPSNICYTTSGFYNVQLIASNALGTDTTIYTNYIEVFNVAPQAITQVGDTLFANQGFVTYVWYYNGNIINGATNYYYVATQNGDYNVISFDANGCDVEAVAFNVLTAVNSIENTSDIVIYPNPVNDLMEIRGVKGAAISLFNIIGALIINDLPLLDAGNGISTVDVSLLPAGVYIVEMKFADRAVHTKIIKQ